MIKGRLGRSQNPPGFKLMGVRFSPPAPYLIQKSRPDKKIHQAFPYELLLPPIFWIGILMQFASSGFDAIRSAIES